MIEKFKPCFSPQRVGVLSISKMRRDLIVMLRQCRTLFFAQKLEVAASACRQMALNYITCAQSLGIISAVQGEVLYRWARGWTRLGMKKMRGRIIVRER